jgi:hypothetical protein
MAEELHQIVERVVARVFEQQLPKLQAELVASVIAEMPAPSSSAMMPAGTQTSNGLASAVASIHAGSTQKEILKGLLDAASSYASRVALFVVKSGAASGWQSRGLGDDESIKDFPLDMTSGPAAHAFQNRIVAPANIAEMDRRFVKQFGGPENEQILILPLVLKDKVAALLYADGGTNSLLDTASLEVLVVASSAWLEVASLRKQAQARDVGELAASTPMSAPVHAVSSYSDPFAGHTPKHTAVMATPEPAADVVEATVPASAAAAPAVAKDPLAEMSPEDADTHRKAQRFARLLVDEIKLYNQAKVAEGRRNKNLYDRLKDDIEKSRTTFQKRYGNTVAASADYFQKEVVRSLAEDDAAVMGPNFRK